MLQLQTARVIIDLDKRCCVCYTAAAAMGDSYRCYRKPDETVAELHDLTQEE